jgi:hypothetical protein
MPPRLKGHAMPTKTRTSAVTVRLAGAEDEDLVNVLSELDAAPALIGRKLLAFVDGWPVAALSLHDGRVVATPFAPTEEAVAMLRLRAEQLWSRQGGRERRRRRRARPLSLVRPRPRPA